MRLSKSGYKIHGLDTVLGISASANTSRFYDSIEEAREAAISCLKRSNRNPTGIVIFQAIEVVSFETPPVKCEPIEIVYRPYDEKHPHPHGGQR